MIEQLAADFFGALASMEERVGTERRIEKEDDYLKKCVLNAKAPLDELISIRHKALIRCETGHKGKKSQVIKLNVLHKCKSDIIYFVNNWAWIFNPWLTRFDSLVEGGFPSTVPFILFPRAKEYLLWREDLYRRQRIGLVYKARELGVSWDNCVSQVWHWLFEDGYQGRMGSRKEALVDSKRNPDSLFWKVRFVIYHTPKWFRHPEMSPKRNSHDTLLSIVNPTNGAMLGGEGGDNMGTGGRGSIYDVDEWAKVEHDRMVETGLSANCRCRIYTGTPNGMDNDYAQKFHSGKVEIFDFNWTHDPRKNHDWYENFKEEHDEAIVAQEIDRKFDAMNVGQCIPPEWVAASVELYERIQSGAVEYPADQDKVSGMDVAAGGRNRTVMLWRDGIVVRDCYEWNERNTTTITEMSGSKAEEVGVSTFNFDPISCGVGVRSAFEKLKEHGQGFNFEAVGVDYRGAASEEPLPGDTKPARERCINRRAELAVRLRKRFEKTYEFINKKISHPLDDMVAIPNNPKLRAQLSLPDLLARHGRWRLEDKESMAKRGIDSPDYFDACCLCFAEESQKKVIKSYSSANSSSFNILWNAVNRQQGSHYVAIQHEQTNAAALGAVWWHQTHTLQVYDEILTSTPTVVGMIQGIMTKFGGSVHEYIGNREMFGKDEQDSLFTQYLDHNILVCQNVQYNEISAIAQIEEMFSMNQIQLHPRCRNLRAQLEDWDRVKGGIAKLNKTLAYALCSMINFLEEQDVFTPKAERRSRYTRRQMPEEPMVEQVWMSKN